MKKLFFLFAAALAACSPVRQAQNVSQGTRIGGVVWATVNVAEAGRFAADAWDFGGHYTYPEALTVCPQGWRAPTMAEFESLLAASSVWTTVNGVAGRWLWSDGNRLFLPAAAYQGEPGGYWSSTPLGEARALGLAFGPDGMFPGSDERGNGNSVRCVRE